MIHVVRAAEVIDLPEEPAGGPIASDLWHALRSHATLLDLFDEERLPDELCRRIDEAQERIWLWSPWVGRRSEQLLPHLRAAEDRGVRVHLVVLPSKEVNRQLKPRHEELETQIARTVHLRKEHQKIVIIDRNLTFIGSMNVLAHVPGGRHEIMALFQSSALVGISTDEISGTVLTYGLRPPGSDRWSAMMRERADLGSITHLTVHELRQAGELTRPGEVMHACENPQVLQRFAAAGVARPLACTSGNPAAAGALLLKRTAVRYHGDFDWPGIAIARRIVNQGARPWRLGCADYHEALERLPSDRQLMLTGRAETTPWDRELYPAMITANVAVHE